MSSGYISYTASNNTSTVTIPYYVYSGSYVGIDWGLGRDVATEWLKEHLKNEKKEDKKEELKHEELKSEI